MPNKWPSRADRREKKRAAAAAAAEMLEQIPDMRYTVIAQGDDLLVVPKDRVPQRSSIVE